LLAALIRIRWLSWIFAAVAVVFAGFALRDAAVNVFSRSNPSLALAISPGDPRALPLLMDRAAFAGQAERARIDQAAQLRRGLRDMPLSARILRLVAAADSQSQPERAATMLAISGQVSRRDMLTEVLLADAYARTGDAAGSIRHLNTALSTSPGAGDLAFPFLVQLLAEPEFRPMIAQYVDQPWGDEFLYFAAQHGPAANALEVALRNPVAQSEGRFARFRAELLPHLVSQGDAGLAFDYVRRLKGPSAPVLADPGFAGASADPAFAPLSWALTNKDGVYADLIGQRGVLLSADPGVRGVAVERIFELAPGTWQFTVHRTLVERARQAQAGWQFSCASGTDSRSLALAEMPLSETEDTVRTRFNVPRECGAVRIALQVHNLDDQRVLELRLDELTLRRVEG